MNKQNDFLKFIVDLDDAGTRLDVYLSNIMTNVSRSRVQQLIEEQDYVKVNDKHSKSSYKIKISDNIVVCIPEPKPLELLAEDIPLDIRYEDSNMIVVNKPSGMLTHPTSVEKEHTLVNALLYHCRGNLSGINGIMRPGILHRLDRETSGLLMIAKNDFAHQFLSEQIKHKTAKRQYLAVVHGVISEDAGRIEAHIDRHPTQRHKMGVVEGGKQAVTYWKVLERFDKFTYIELTLETGRTHQIRVHLSNINHPVAGDPLYGGNNMKINLNGQALQAYKLTFTCPTDNEVKVIQIEPDDDITKLLNILRKR
jgi:23S rRNA pseudouridine1911/1915/1917 synthase